MATGVRIRVMAGVALLSTSVTGTSSSAIQAAQVSPPLQLSHDVTFVAAVGPALTPLGATRFCFSYPDQCRASPPIFRPKRLAATQRQLQDLDEVNRTVNRAIRPKPDLPGLINDLWTIAPAAGDCDNYAVTKRAELLKRGWSSRSLLLAQVVAANGESHLVLVARTRLGDFVLDNLTPGVLPAARTRLRWVAIQSSSNPHVWRAAALAERDGGSASALLTQRSPHHLRNGGQIASAERTSRSP
jgi:predicted transglutaminase-like cysteine proteinase